MPRGDRGGTSTGTGVRCVAYGCGKTNVNGVSMHFFPKDPTLRRQWADFVRVKRAKWAGPTEYSALCSDHFTPESYPFRVRFEIEHMGKRPAKEPFSCKPKYAIYRNQYSLKTADHFTGQTAKERQMWHLKEHEAKEHTDTPKYSCITCNQGFMSKTFLQTHVLSHVEDKQYEVHGVSSQVFS